MSGMPRLCASVYPKRLRLLPLSSITRTPALPLTDATITGARYCPPGRYGLSDAISTSGTVTFSCASTTFTPVKPATSLGQSHLDTKFFGSFGAVSAIRPPAPLTTLAWPFPIACAGRSRNRPPTTPTPPSGRSPHATQDISPPTNVNPLAPCRLASFTGRSGLAGRAVTSYCWVQACIS